MSILSLVTILEVNFNLFLRTINERDYILLAFQNNARIFIFTPSKANISIK